MREKSPLPGGLRNQYAAARSVTRAIAAANASQTVMGRRGVLCTSVSLSATSRAVGRASGTSGEHRRDQVVKRCRQIGAERRRPRRFLFGYGLQKRESVFRLVRIPAGCQLVEDHAEREDVACLRGRLSQASLGRQITQRSGELRPACLLRLRVEGEAEIEQFDVAVVAHHHVLGLDVAMDQPMIVSHSERMRQLGAPAKDFIEGRAFSGSRRGA